MNGLKISRIRAKNVLTWKILDLVIPENQVLGVQGGNYSGKSNLVDIVFLAFFNKTLRAHRKDSVVTDGEKDWSLELDFSVGGHSYSVIRGSNYCSFKQLGDKNPVVGVLAVNEKMAQTLNCTFSQFSNISYLGQNRNQSLASLTASDRRKIISPFLDLPDFKRLNDKVKVESRQADRDHVLYEERVSSLSQRIEQAGVADALKISTLKKNQSDLKEKLIPSQTKYNAIQKRVAQFEEKENSVETEILEMGLAIREKETAQEGYSSILKMLKSSSSRCPACFSFPTEDSKTEASSFARKKLKGVVLSLESCREEESTRKIFLKKIRSILSSLKKEKAAIGQVFHDSMNQLKALKQEIAHLESNESVAPLRAQLSLARKGFSLASHRLENLDFWSTALGSRGLPSFLLEEVIEDLSGRVTVYLNDILPGVVCRFHYDRDIKVSITNNGRSRSFEACSGAERRLIDLASSFALRDIALERYGNAPSFVLLDEIFDSLDDDHLQVVQLWLNKLKGCTVLLITHNTSMKDWLPSVKEVHYDPERGSYFN